MNAYGQFRGRLGKDPETKSTRTGKEMVVGSLAVAQGKDRKPIWMELTCFDKHGEKLMQLSKGDMVLVQGRIEMRYFKRKDGSEGSELKLWVDGLGFADMGKAGSQDPPREPGSDDDAGAPNDDDIPF